MIHVACNKATQLTEKDIAFKKISDKTWYLAYAEVINGSNPSIKSYIGQPTYFINYLKNYATLDSDGINGVYNFEYLNQQLLLKVVAKTPNGYSSNYQYEVISIGDNNLILSYKQNNNLTKLYFTTNR